MAVIGPAASPTILERKRLQLADPATAGSAQPFHAAEPLPLKQAQQHIQRCIGAGQRLARKGLREMLENLRRDGYQPVACGLLLSSARPLPEFAAILASHALIHTAEGELFRDLLAEAAQHHGLRLLRLKERDMLERYQAHFRRLSEMGRTLGPPWQQDQKLAALVALLALDD